MEHAPVLDMVVYRFEDLRVWQNAKELNDRIGELTKRPEFRRDPELCAQLNAAGLSVMNNIAEGFLRHNDPEFMQFLRYSASSNGEVRSTLTAAEGRQYLPQSEASDLIERTNQIGRQIRRLQQTLNVPSPRPRTKDEGRPRTKDEGRPRTKDEGRPRTEDQGRPRTKA